MTAIDRRASGVLLHVSSLHGDYSIGSFGKPAYEFVDFFGTHARLYLRAYELQGISNDFTRFAHQIYLFFAFYVNHTVLFLKTVQLRRNFFKHSLGRRIAYDVENYPFLRIVFD